MIIVHNKSVNTGQKRESTSSGCLITSKKRLVGSLLTSRS